MDHTTIEEVAFHEAGHAIVALYFEHLEADDLVTVVGDENRGSLGHVAHNNPVGGRDSQTVCSDLEGEGLIREASGLMACSEIYDDRVREFAMRARHYIARFGEHVGRVQAEEAIMIAMAGVEAGERGTGVRNDEGAASDFAAVDEVLDALVTCSEGYGEREREPYRQLLRARTIALIDERWHHVEQLVEALLTKRTLTGSEVKDLLGPKRRPDGTLIIPPLPDE